MAEQPGPRGSGGEGPTHEAAQRGFREHLASTQDPQQPARAQQASGLPVTLGVRVRRCPFRRLPAACRRQNAVPTAVPD